MIDKSGKVLAAEPGSPGGTLEVAKKVTAAAKPASEPVANGANGATKEDIALAKAADEVADTAEKLDGDEAKPAAA